MTITGWGKTYEIDLNVTTYQNNKNLAIQMLCKDPEEGYWEPYGMLTVNLDKELPENQAYVDTNNIPNAEKFILDNNLGTPTGDVGLSGFCAYPLYKFNLENI